MSPSASSHSIDAPAPTTGGAPAGAAPGTAPGGLRGHLRRRPLTWFFTLAFALSWVAWTPYVLSENGLGVWHFSFPSALGTTQLLGVLPGAYLGPILSAFLVTALTDGRDGLRVWFGRFTKWRISRRWYAAVILSVPVALTVTSAALGGRGPVLPSAALLVAYLPGLILQMLTTGLAEEPGWRDFATPRLQRRYGPLVGTLILGPLWGAWHLPLFLSDWGGGPDVSWTEPLEFMLTTFAFSFVMTWFFNHTRESLPLVMLLHTGVNNYFSLAWSDMFPWLRSTTHVLLIASAATAAVLLIATRGRLGYEPERAGLEPAEPGTPRV
ncbi:membrane protease YdiL (CAAX protease family) [Streptomyces sp. B3I7]|uniref:CPBP family intramembrane glutamic endopeptidase n=1 Tax=Streptomyces sp. B3I7 TaxID=3042269 RepID=UPI002789AD5E|nr:type II CAAX endopeptidase family protein [Streptomyces sp. B3I7]MDQ0813213.1 membrane protease YdiL (CAAX protease family) [Streptomyces sp. B3I7]